MKLYRMDLANNKGEYNFGNIYLNWRRVRAALRNLDPRWTHIRIRRVTFWKNQCWEDTDRKIGRDLFGELKEGLEVLASKRNN